MIGVLMAMLFRADDLLVTEEQIRSGAGTYQISDVRSVWVSRGHLARGGRMLTATVGVGVLVVLVAGAGASGWLINYWRWLVVAPVAFFAAAWIGLLDPFAIFLEKRHHELWISTDSGRIRLWRHNSIEANKAMRAIQRARERHHERNEV